MAADHGATTFGSGAAHSNGETIGDVVDVRLFHFTLMEVGNWVGAEQSTGRVIHVPNARLFHDALANYHSGFAYIWAEVPVLLTFESDWRKAKELFSVINEAHSAHLKEEVQQSVAEAAKRYLIRFSHLTPIVYTSVKDSGVLLTLRFLCDPRKRRKVEEDVWEALLECIEAHPTIDLAYYTQRIYRTQPEP